MQKYLKFISALLPHENVVIKWETQIFIIFSIYDTTQWQRYTCTCTVFIASTFINEIATYVHNKLKC